ncbi:MAG TPA: hypothetical protein VND99_05065 [Candidatus Acidoferrales bacterium]|nr:hypothetical protein [Candidatus Acidoferrales bacterium]
MAEHSKAISSSAFASGEASSIHGSAGLSGSERQKSDARTRVRPSVAVRTGTGGNVGRSVMPRGLHSALSRTGADETVQVDGFRRVTTDLVVAATAEVGVDHVHSSIKIDSPFVRGPLEAITAYGPIEVRETAEGHQVLLLPSRTVSEESLDVTRWARRTGMGNQRPVYTVDELSTGENPKIVVKEGERRFTTSRADLARGQYWWQGNRSGVKPVTIHDPLVEVQTFWEAAMLTELHRDGIPVEIPQALIVNPDGRVSLVVANIDEGYGSSSGPSLPSLLEQVRTETSLLPADDAGNGYNCIIDRTGVNRIIDVNRWRWQGRTDEIDTAMIALVGSSLQ